MEKHAISCFGGYPQSLGAHMNSVTNSLLINSFPSGFPYSSLMGLLRFTSQINNWDPTFLTLVLFGRSNPTTSRAQDAVWEDTEALSGECIQAEAVQKQPRSWEI